jgi:hypothetical protein
VGLGTRWKKKSGVLALEEEAIVLSGKWRRSDTESQKYAMMVPVASDEDIINKRQSCTILPEGSIICRIPPPDNREF